MQIRQGLRFVIVIASVLAAATSCSTAHRQDRPLRRASVGAVGDLDAYVERALRDWSVPGVAVAVVKDDEVVHIRGYGVLENGKAEQVDTNTLFSIGSCTKAFTATALAMLVADGKLEWDRPVVAYMPSFRLADPYATANATARDLLTNRSGAPGIAKGEIAIYGRTRTSEEVLDEVAKLTGWSFRERFDYSNAMYVAAGELVPAVTSRTYHDFVSERLLLPLAMVRSTTSTATLASRTNVAAPHRRTGGSTRVVRPFNVDHLVPAGSIHSSAAEMARWIRLQLAHGRIGDRRLLDEALVRMTHEPAVVIPRDPLWMQSFPAADILTWGMGWTVSTYRGERVVEHVGIGGGMHAGVGLMPGRNLGVVILTNLGFPENQLPAVLRYRIYDALLGLPERDWSAELLRQQNVTVR